MDVYPEALRSYADRVEEVWTSYVDEDVMEAAEEAVAALRTLAKMVGA